jgi:uncharacterized membrane protein YraQ (UPF0718 family)
MKRSYLLTASGGILWPILYSYLEPFSRWIVSFLPSGVSDSWRESMAFFAYDAPKVLMLLVLVVFLMGIVRSFFSPERTRALLTGRREGVGNIVAACLGIVTPFCSCSAVPLFIGFVSTGVPLGITLSFLIAAPLVNEIALGLLWGLVGWKIAMTYLAFGLVIAIVAGWIIGRMHLEDWLEGWVREIRSQPQTENVRYSLHDRLMAGWDAVCDIVGRVWLWMLLGVAVGAFIHGYAPSDLLIAVMGRDTWLAVPASVLIGIPIYSNAAGIIPIVEALLGKGAALGTVLAFMMSVTALSLPEAILLRKVMSARLVVLFFSVVACGILAVGYFFNLIL